KVQQLKPKLYDGNVIKNTYAIVIPDSEETLMLAEESHSKMLVKQQDPMVLEKKVNTTPVYYANSMNSSDPIPSCRPTKVEVSKELLKVSMVNTSLKKLKHHLVGFDVVIKERTTTTAITEDSWGFEHTKVALMANLSHYGSDALAEVHIPDNVDNNMINQSVQVMSFSKKMNVVNHSKTEITSNSNIIPYSQYVTDSQ
nr:hypothetical protein [Tanacetum cinerariifolium]